PSLATRRPAHYHHLPPPHRHSAPIPNTTHTSPHTPQKDALPAAAHCIPHTPSPAPARSAPANVAPSVAARTPQQAVPTACTSPCELPPLLATVWATASRTHRATTHRAERHHDHAPQA